MKHIDNPAFDVNTDFHLHIATEACGDISGIECIGNRLACCGRQYRNKHHHEYERFPTLPSKFPYMIQFTTGHRLHFCMKDWDFFRAPNILNEQLTDLGY